MNLSVVIPSCNAVNLTACVQSIRIHEPDVDIVVADDGIDWSKVSSVPDYLYIVDCPKPFIFSRNCNLGIRVAEGDDVILLNDDTLLKTTNGFTKLQQQAKEHPEYGVISAVTNSVGNPRQLYRNVGLRDEPTVLCFICVLLPRSTIDTVGLLDERFTAYGWEDNDYSLRTTKAGLKLGIYDDCFVDHATLKSSFRGDNQSVDITANKLVYDLKWGGQA